MEGEVVDAAEPKGNEAAAAMGDSDVGPKNDDDDEGDAPPPPPNGFGIAVPAVVKAPLLCVMLVGKVLPPKTEPEGFAEEPKGEGAGAVKKDDGGGGAGVCCWSCF